ncbi:MAG: TatD family hydrolase [Sulfolobales archaeon]
MIYDAHCHLHEFPDEYIERLVSSNNYVITAVSDDFRSSLRTLKLYEKFRESINPCIGIHPWVIERTDKKDLEMVLGLIERLNIGCIGEVGLDRVFVPQSIDKQIEFFLQILEFAKSKDIVLNIHAPGAWSQVLELLRRYDIGKAIIHWYTGPQELLREIGENGYMISINPAVKIQRKHQEIVSKADLEIILVESDGPYEYKGLKLSPELIEDTISFIAEIKKIDSRELKKIIQSNYKKLFK